MFSCYWRLHGSSLFGVDMLSISFFSFRLLLKEGMWRGGRQLSSAEPCDSEMLLFQKYKKFQHRRHTRTKTHILCGHGGWQPGLRGRSLTWNRNSSMRPAWYYRTRLDFYPHLKGWGRISSFGFFRFVWKRKVAFKAQLRNKAARGKKAGPGHSRREKRKADTENRLRKKAKEKRKV